MTARVQQSSKFFAFVRKYRNALGLLLMLLAFGAMALDYFHRAQLGPRLLYLRFVYAVLALLISGYVFIISTMTEVPKSK